MISAGASEQGIYLLMSIPGNPLIDHLIRDGSLSVDDVSVLWTEHKISGKSLETLMLDAGIMDEDALLDLSARLRQCQTADPVQYMDSIQRLYPMIPLDVWEQCHSVPIHYDETISTLRVAMADVSDIQAQDLLMRHLPASTILSPVLSKKSSIISVLQGLYPPSNPMDVTQCAVGDKIINRFLHQIIVKAVEERTSDIHFQPEKFKIKVRCRKDGLLHTMQTFHTSFWQPLCIQLKILAAMDIAETRRPQDGRFSLLISGRTVDFRVSAHPTVYGENLVLRILDQQHSLIALEKLGYSAHNMANIRRILDKPEGLIILTGPTGSGKTTSLYSMLTTLDHEQINIMTLEEPIEYHVPNIRQSEVKEKSQFDFIAGMHSLLRQDPDVILIGEIRDEKTADMAIRAGMTGHRVLTTLHTVHALGTIYRLIELQVPISLLAGVLNGVVAQRLIRLLCSACKLPVHLEVDQAKDHNLWPQVDIFRAQGCPQCGFSGYHGRKAIAEVMVMDADIEALILDRAPHHALQRALTDKGFRSMHDDATEAVIRGETSLSEIHRVMGSL
ncbi:MAG: type II/IV secretion system protein [Alphaproteobacteria bacterium]|nr:type II/IV secretion system protein [Alphaproteobacteria bacterium]